MANKIEIGNRVAYASRFLKSICALSGPMPFARGEVTELQELGPDITLAHVDWGPHAEDCSHLVNVKNLIRVDDLPIEPR